MPKQVCGDTYQTLSQVIGIAGKWAAKQQHINIINTQSVFTKHQG